MGERIYLRRKSMGYTQEVLAEKMDVSVQMISGLELGKKAIRPENLVKLSKILEVSTDYILTGEESRFTASIETRKIASLDSDDIELIDKIIELCLSKK